MSREHVMARWMSRELKSRGIDAYWVSGTRPLRRTKTLDATVREVCAECNNGWLSDMENDARPLLLGLAFGDLRPIELSRADQTLLASWAVKTALVAERSNGWSAIPARHYGEFHEYRNCHATSGVWLGAHAGEMQHRDEVPPNSPVTEFGFRDFAWAPEPGSEGPPGFKLHLYSIHVGHCVFAVAQVVDPDDLAFSFDPTLDVAESLIRIWPEPPESAVWPRGAFTPDAYRAFLRSRWLL